MADDTQKFRLLQQQIAEYRRIQTSEKQLQEKIKTMEALLPQLEEQAEAEEADVVHMEQGSLISIFYSAIGRYDKKIEKERQEAQAAQIKYLDAMRTLEELRRQQWTLQEKLNSLGKCQEKYYEALNSKRQAILSEGGAKANHLLELAQRAMKLQSSDKELQEALDAGTRVLDQILLIEDALSSASNWGVADMFGGGFISDIAKYGHLDNAQQEFQYLNQLLIQYTHELQDLNINFQMRINIGDGLRFADFFFDGLIADSMALDRIHRMQEQVSELRYQVEERQKFLKNKQDSLLKEQEMFKKQVEAWIISA